MSLPHFRESGNKQSLVTIEWLYLRQLLAYNFPKQRIVLKCGLFLSKSCLSSGKNRRWLLPVLYVALVFVFWLRRYLTINYKDEMRSRSFARDSIHSNIWVVYIAQIQYIVDKKVVLFIFIWIVWFVNCVRSDLSGRNNVLHASSATWYPVFKAARLSFSEHPQDGASCCLNSLSLGRRLAWSRNGAGQLVMLYDLEQVTACP